MSQFTPWARPPCAARYRTPSMDHGDGGTSSSASSRRDPQNEYIEGAAKPVIVFSHARLPGASTGGDIDDIGDCEVERCSASVPGKRSRAQGNRARGRTRCFRRGAAYALGAPGLGVLDFDYSQTIALLDRSHCLDRDVARHIVENENQLDEVPDRDIDNVKLRSLDDFDTGGERKLQHNGEMDNCTVQGIDDNGGNCDYVDNDIGGHDMQLGDACGGDVDGIHDADKDPHHQFDEAHDYDVKEVAYGMGRGHHHAQSSSQHAEMEPSSQAPVSGGGSSSHGHHRVSSSGQRMRERRAEASIIACEHYHPMDFLEPQDVSALATVRCYTSAAAGWILEFLSRWAQRIVADGERGHLHQASQSYPRQQAVRRFFAPSGCFRISARRFTAPPKEQSVRYWRPPGRKAGPRTRAVPSRATGAHSFCFVFRSRSSDCGQQWESHSHASP
mmetsp:Transcript_114592/g.364208  ORF Transcript_114592/g.364208 Transcript_114592/m.364208 type:complete len:445 (+) Transcript_114592:79-1413(+)